MKKTKIMLFGLALLPLMIACASQSNFIPRYSYPGDPINGNPGGGGEGGESGEPVDPMMEEENMTVNFYLDYSHSDEPIYSMRWYMLVPLKECPQEAILKETDAADPLYSKFLGYSEYPSSIDESKIWNFETDYKQSNVLNLYGIWVSA